jgi:uncharacterized protein (TIGR02246 family)
MIRLSVVLLLPFVLLLLLPSCSQGPASAPPDTRSADEKAISDGEVAWVADWKSKDIDKIVSHYADDAIFMEPAMPAMKGKEAIRSGQKVFLQDKNFNITFTTIRVEASKAGDLAYSHGTYAATMTDPKSNKPVSEIGKWVCVYRKQADGSWKSILDIDNPDGPAR